MSIKKHIPNILTCGNLLCGLLGITLVLSSPIEHLGMPWLLYLNIAAGIFDFLDGLMARVLKVSSSIGKELDSLADMVSFGVLPGMILFQMMQQNFVPSNSFEAFIQDNNTYIPYLAFLIPVFSALRLAKFNIDTRQSDSFIGVPTPANTLFIIGLAYIYIQENSVFAFLTNPISLVLLCLILSYMMVAELPLIALKFKNLSWLPNKMRYLLIISTIILFLIFSFTAIPIIIILYIILSLIEHKLLGNQI